MKNYSGDKLNRQKHCNFGQNTSWYNVVPSNKGHTFLQHVIPPSLVNCPSAVSRKNTGMPQNKKNTTYGIRKAPERQQHK